MTTVEQGKMSQLPTKNMAYDSEEEDGLKNLSLDMFPCCRRFRRGFLLCAG